MELPPRSRTITTTFGCQRNARQQARIPTIAQIREGVAQAFTSPPPIKKRA
jgi:hypothetical protein